MKYTYSILPPLRKGESELHQDIVRLQSETNIRWEKFQTITNITGQLPCYIVIFA